MSITVSVVVPTHHRPHFLGRTIESLLRQTYPHTEIVIVDDNEPDSKARKQTEQVVAQYAAYSNIVYIQNPHPLGGGLARNAGIQACSGDYVTFLDDDDVYLPEKIDTQLSFMLERDLDMSFTDVFLHGADEKLVEYRRHTYVHDCSNAELMRQHVIHSLCPTSSYMIRRSFLLQTDGFRDVSMGQDFMLMYDMIEHNAKIGYLPVSYIIQYLHDGDRISVGKNKINGEKNLFAFKKTKLDILNAEERRYVRFRHYAVLCVAHLRSGSPLQALRYAIICLFCSPILVVREMKTFFRNRRIAKKERRLR